MNKPVVLITSSILILLISVLPVRAQVQSPEEFLGYQLGQRWTLHHQVLDYVAHVARQSDYVTLEKYGETYEHRDLVYLVITSPENHDRIEEIRLNNLRMTGLEEGIVTDQKKAIVWLSYNIHGDETSSSEAAMKTLYELIRPENTRYREWLQNTVVIMDPMVNPDGRDRYVNWYKQIVGESPNANPKAREHHQPWPEGRANHYLFDLNRDWAWQVQKESRERHQAYKKWFPHIHVDYHEQGYQSPYYFAPAAEPFHKAITDWQREFQTVIGKNHTRYFDEEGWLYFTRQRFDLFYPSYGDTWPTFHGAIGMTYEQAGQVGLSMQRAEGDTLTLKDRLLHHHITGLSTIEVASRHAERITDEFQTYFERARNNPSGQYKTFVVSSRNDEDKIHNLLRSLENKRIDLGTAGREIRTDAYNYSTGSTERVEVKSDDIVISTYQPQGNLVRVLFEPNPELSDSITYDITTWEAHYRFGLEGYAVTDRIDPEGDVTSGTFRSSEITGPEQPYAYLLRWDSMDDARLLAEITERGVNSRFATMAFEIDNQSFDRGTIVIPRNNNQHLGDSFDRIVRESAENHSRHLHGSSTGYVTTGADFGSSDVKYIDHPNVALVTGEGTSSLNAGEIWHFLDRQLKYPATLINTSSLLHIGLDEFDVLFLPSGSYQNILTDSAVEKLGEWVQSGGTLIVFGSANEVFAGKDGFDLEMKSKESVEKSSEDLLQPYDQRSRRYASRRNPGSVFRVTLDTTHPLAFGYNDSYLSLKTNADAYEFLKSGWNVGALRGDAHMSGFAGSQAKEMLQNTLSFGVQSHGSGQIVYFIDNPLYRGFWQNGKLLVANALFLVGN